MSEKGAPPLAWLLGTPQGTSAHVPRWWGLIAYLFYALHAAHFISVGRPANLLWGCHMATLGVGTGLLLRSPVFNGLGLLTLFFGTPLWLIHISTGGEFLPTSMGTHLGGFVLGIVGVRALGMPRFTWAKLVVMTAGLMYLSYVLGPAHENVNMCHGPPPAWKSAFPPYPLFGVIVLSAAAVQFFVAQVVLRWFYRPLPRRGLRTLLREFFVVGFGVAWLAALFALIAPVALVYPTLAWRNRCSLLAGRLLSRMTLFLCGIRVDYEGLERLKHPSILTFNHTTVLDFLFNAELAGSRCLVFGKRSLARLPFLGWAWVLGGHPLIRREEPVQWRAELDRVVELLRGGYSTMVAPEGSRSPSGELLPFKKGPFHLAIASGLPIVPVVIQGGDALLRGRRVAMPGTVRVRVLEAIETTGWSEATLEEHLERVRAVYVEALADAPPPAPVEAASVA